MSAPLLQIRDLRISFQAKDSARAEALRGIDLTLEPGKVLGIVGESGSGKSIAMMAFLQLLPKGAHVTGSAMFNGQELIGMPASRIRRIRGKAIGCVFQDPLSAFNPVIRIGITDRARRPRIRSTPTRTGGLRRPRPRRDPGGPPSPTGCHRGRAHQPRRRRWGPRKKDWHRFATRPAPTCCRRNPRGPAKRHVWRVAGRETHERRLQPPWTTSPPRQTDPPLRSPRRCSSSRTVPLTKSGSGKALN